MSVYGALTFDPRLVGTAWNVRAHRISGQVRTWRREGVKMDSSARAYADVDRPKANADITIDVRAMRTRCGLPIIDDMTNGMAPMMTFRKRRARHRAKAKCR